MADRRQQGECKFIFVERNPLSLVIAQFASRTISSLFTNFCYFFFWKLRSKYYFDKFCVFCRAFKLMRQWMLLWNKNNSQNKRCRDAGSVQDYCSVASLIPFVNALCSLVIAQFVSRTISSLFTNFCYFSFENLEAKIILTNFACSAELLSLCDSECFCEIKIILKINAVATPAAFKPVLSRRWFLLWMPKLPKLPQEDKLPHSNILKTKMN